MNEPSMLSIVTLDVDADRTLVLYAAGMDEVAVLRLIRGLIGDSRTLVPFMTSREHVERFQMNAHG